MRPQGEAPAEQVLRLWRTMHRFSIEDGFATVESVNECYVEALAPLDAGVVLSLLREIRQKWMQAPGILDTSGRTATSRSRNQFERNLPLLLEIPKLASLSDPTQSHPWSGKRVTAADYFRAILNEINAWAAGVRSMPSDAPREAFGVGSTIRERALETLERPKGTVWLPAAYSGGAWELGRHGRR